MSELAIPTAAEVAENRKRANAPNLEKVMLKLSDAISGGRNLVVVELGMAEREISSFEGLASMIPGWWPRFSPDKPEFPLVAKIKAMLEPKGYDVFEHTYRDLWSESIVVKWRLIIRW